ncbi:hypothetical protein NC651_030796 [Populus alba x Populus x berolinensis]|nr:hypothetical protein NC651_030796 [Populus alba x Populus x berolinensis]
MIDLKILNFLLRSESLLGSHHLL